MDRISKQQLLEAVFPFTAHSVMLVDDDISPETNKVLVSSATGTNGGAIAQVRSEPLALPGVRQQIL